MKKSAIAAALVCVCATSCDRNRSIAKTPADPAPAPVVEVVEPRPPAAIRVVEPEDFKVAEEEPGTPEIIEPAPTPGQRLDNAIEKTENGVRRAAEATGRGLQRAGDAIERKAEEKSR